MRRKNYYRNNRGGGWNQPSWGRNSNYRNDNQDRYAGPEMEDDRGHRETRSHYNRNYGPTHYNSGGWQHQGGNQYGNRGYGGSGFGGGRMHNNGQGWQEQNDYYHNPRNSGRGYDERDHDRNFFERAGDRIRDRWNDWNDRDQDDYRGRGRGYDNSYVDQRDGDRNFFERTGGKIREKWNDWTDNDDRDYTHNERFGNRYSGYPENNYRNRSSHAGQHHNYPENGSRNRNRFSQHDEYPGRGHHPERSYYNSAPSYEQGSSRGRRHREEEYSY